MNPLFISTLRNLQVNVAIHPTGSSLESGLSTSSISVHTKILIMSYNNDYNVANLLCDKTVPLLASNKIAGSR
jgi:hypothetical protein